MNKTNVSKEWMLENTSTLQVELEKYEWEEVLNMLDIYVRSGGLSSVRLATKFSTSLEKVHKELFK